jgi:Domain of unknown function (DUF4198)
LRFLKAKILSKLSPRVSVEISAAYKVVSSTIRKGSAMRISIIAVLLLTLAIQAQTANTEPGTASISGRVTLNGKPAKHINVTLVPGPYGSPDTPGRQKAKTDDEGRYQFKNLAAGRYGLVAASYLNTSTDFLESTTRPFKVCTIATGEELKEVEITLVRGGVMTGRVTDTDGNAVIATSIQLTFLDGQNKKQNFPSFQTNDEMFATDDRGVYRLFGLPPGRYLVGVGIKIGQGEYTFGSTRGYYKRTYHPNATDEAQATIIEVKAEEEATGIDIRVEPMEKTYQASGRVIDAETGQAVAGSLYDFGIVEGEKLRSAYLGFSADEMGQFKLPGLVPNRYGVTASGGVNSNHFSDPTFFEINDKDVEGLELKLQRGATISGVAVIEGSNDPAILAKLAATYVTAENMSYTKIVNIYPSRAKIQSNGRFNFSGFRPGKIRFDLVGEWQGFSILRVEHNGAELRDSLEVKSGEQLNNLRVVIAYSNGIVRGTVNFINGLSPNDALVKIELRRTGGNTAARVVEMDSNKRFVLQGVADGEYELIAQLLTRSNNTISQTSQPQRLRVTNGATTDVTLTLNLR